MGPNNGSASMTLVMLVGFICLVFIGLVQADLPIHCKHCDVLGRWKIQMTALGGGKATCGYSAPDRNAAHLSPDNKVQQLEDAASEAEVELISPQTFKVVSEHTDAPIVDGTWTMVADEGMYLKWTKDGQLYSLVAFFKYHQKSNIDFNTDQEVRDYISDCDDTMVGWFHGPNQKQGCWQARKVSKRHNTPIVSDNSALQPDHHLNVVSPNPISSVTADTFEPNYAFIEMINKDESQNWEATVHKQFVGMKLKEMMKMLGVRKYRTNTLAAAAVIDDSVGGVGPDGDMESVHKGKYGNLPRHFDWRNVSGVNYLPPIKNQGSCGSCYAVAAVDALESRIRIATNNSVQPLLSAQSPLCESETNQGCDGGYPFLLSHHAATHGIFPESCLAYTGSDTTCPASIPCDDSQRHFVEDGSFGYVGGYYGACNELDMMHEIYRHGPIMVAFEAPQSLFYYESGIFECTTEQPAVEAEGPEAKVNPWKHTNHAVSAVGWGEEVYNGNTKKYWIIRNTWGNWPTPTSDGYFRIRRGTDECAIESMAVTPGKIIQASQRR